MDDKTRKKARLSRIGQLREQKTPYSQKQASSLYNERTGNTSDVYGDFDRDPKRLPKLDQAAVIADIFDCTIDELAGRTARLFADERHERFSNGWLQLDEEGRKFAELALKYAINYASKRPGTGKDEP